MGVKLMVEVLDYAPEDATPAERLVLLALAEKANDHTREVWPNKGEDMRSLLLKRTGLGVAGLRKALWRLAQRCLTHDECSDDVCPARLEVRTPIGRDKAGRHVFAHEGRATAYRIPTLRTEDLLGTPLAERGDQGNTSESREGRPGEHLGETRGTPLESERGDQGNPLSLTSSENPSDARERELDAGAQEVLRKLGPCDEARAIAATILDRHQPKSLERYIAKIPTKDLESYRSGATRQPSAEKCSHGEVGGRRILGHGEDAARKCYKCDAEDPPAVAS